MVTHEHGRYRPGFRNGDWTDGEAGRHQRSKLEIETQRTPFPAVGQANKTIMVESGATAVLQQELAVDKPSLWSPGSPSQYRAVRRVLNGETAIDEVSTPFGIRSLGWSVESGFLLNDNPVKLMGCCVHHDNGPLGAAALDRAEERRVQILKECGFNAIRT